MDVSSKIYNDSMSQALSNVDTNLNNSQWKSIVDKYKRNKERERELFIRERSKLEIEVASFWNDVMSLDEETRKQFDIPDVPSLTLEYILPELYAERPDRKKHAEDVYRYNQQVQIWQKLYILEAERVNECISKLEGQI